ncbi:MAG: hypothetical protein M0015_00725 [Betaproteobacteria bacterium]|nr:hypothetical protein [Betaproteobacteria bacterium]
MNHTTLREDLARLDAGIGLWEQRLAAREAVALEPALDAATQCALDLIRAYVADEAKKPVPDADADLLEAFKTLAKGDPTWNAVRDSLRELVYYRNCLSAGRADALPAAPEKMAVRLARHLYLYVRTRCEREGRL